MSTDGRSSGFAVAGMLILWIAGAAIALSRVDQDGSTPQLDGAGRASSTQASAPTPDATVTADPTATPYATPLPTPAPSPTAVPTPAEAVAVEPFGSERIVRLGPGEHIGYQFDADGEVVARKAAALTSDSAAHAGERATVRGERYLLILDGIWAGYYLPESERVRVDG